MWGGMVWMWCGRARGKGRREGEGERRASGSGGGAGGRGGRGQGVGGRGREGEKGEGGGRGARGEEEEGGGTEKGEQGDEERGGGGGRTSSMFVPIGCLVARYLKGGGAPFRATMIAAVQRQRRRYRRQASATASTQQAELLCITSFLGYVLPAVAEPRPRSARGSGYQAGGEQGAKTSHDFGNTHHLEIRTYCSIISSVE